MSDTHVVETPAPAGVPVVVVDEGWTVTSGSTGTSQSAEIEREAAAASATEPPSAAPEASAVASEPADAAPTDAAPADVEADAEKADAKDEAKAEKPKKHTPASQRIAEIQAQIRALTAQRHAEQAALERVKRERETLTPKAEPEPVAEDKPTWAKFEAEGKSWDEYAEARDAWHETRNRAWLAQVTKEQQETARKEFEALRAQEAQDAAQRAYDAKIAAVTAKRPDFLQRVTANLTDVPQTEFMADVVRLHPAGAEVLDYLADHPDEAHVLAELTVNATHAMMDAVQQMPDPRPLLTHFARNPDEFARLAGLPPRSALVALGSLMARLDSAKTGSLSPAPVSHAAPPIRPVGGTRSTGTARSQDLTSMPFEEYVERMNKEEAAARRRP